MLLLQIQLMGICRLCSPSQPAKLCNFGLIERENSMLRARQKSALKS